jgi:hypothetical protein
LSRLFRRAPWARTFLASIVIASGAIAVADPKAAVGAPAPTTFAAVGDARVEQNKPAGNFGTDGLRVDQASGADAASYLKFTTSGLAAPVSSAKLRVRVAGNGSAQGASLHTAGTGWTEGGLNWQNAPARAALVGTVAKLPASTWVEFDVTNAVTGNGTFAFVLSKTSGTDGADLKSREETNGPQLVVTTEAAVDPTATPSGATFKADADARVEQK